MSLFSLRLKKAINHLPKIVAKPLHLLPNSLQYKPLESLLNKMFWQFVEDDEFDFLKGRWLRLRVTDMQLSWRIGYDGSRLLVAPDGGDTDVCFSGTANDLILLASRRVDPDTLFFNRRLSIEGNTELGLSIKNLIDSFDMDEMSGFSRWMIFKAGDVAQHIEVVH